MLPEVQYHPQFNITYSLIWPTVQYYLQSNITYSPIWHTVQYYLQSNITYRSILPTVQYFLQTRMAYGLILPTVQYYLQFSLYVIALSPSFLAVPYALPAGNCGTEVHRPHNIPFYFWMYQLYCNLIHTWSLTYFIQFNSNLNFKGHRIGSCVCQLV